MRKTKTVILPATAGRDAGKAFLVTEMDAFRGEKWATRALLSMMKSGIDIPPEVLRMGMGAIAAVGFRALLTMAYEDAEPLLDEMMGCVQVIPDPRRTDVLRPLDPEDVEEVSTLLTLRNEVMEIHTGFSVADFLSNLAKGAAGTSGGQNMPNTETSPNSSET